MSFHVGFTGTQTGLTTEQRARLYDSLLGLKTFYGGIIYMHHGDCVGADVQAHTIADRLDFHIVLHPPTSNAKRAFSVCDEVRKPWPYLRRNRDIVAESDLVVACPKTSTEELRSGTWMTIREARRKHKPLVIIYPDGHVENERLVHA
jgi:hypothetical protein